MTLPARQHRRASHVEAAAAARQAPGTWVTVGTYQASYTAHGIGVHARKARLEAYAPAGAFEARTERTEDGTVLHVRFVGGAS